MDIQLRSAPSSVAVVIELVGAFHRHVDVGGLLGGELSELGADLLEVEAGHHLIEVLRQHVDLLVVLSTPDCGPHRRVRPTVIPMELRYPYTGRCRASRLRSVSPHMARR